MGGGTDRELGCGHAGRISCGRARIPNAVPHIIGHRQLRAAVLAEIDRVVPFDSYAWLLTDPETRVGWSPLAPVPGTLPVAAPDPAEVLDQQ